jgi:hypothetical protein
LSASLNGSESTAPEAWRAVPEPEVNGTRNADAHHTLSVMTRYYFDFRSGDILSVDEEGRELPDADAAHSEALAALGDAIEDVVMQGQSDQQIGVDVRDELGPVLEISAVLLSKFLRKQ